MGGVIAISISVIMSAIYVIVPLPSLPWGIDRAFRYIGFYTIGTILFRTKFDEKVRKLRIPCELIISVILFAISFLLSYKGLYTGIMWFITAMIGTVAVLILSISINRNCILEYLGKISLTILCTHGPVYRIVAKIIAVMFKLSTDVVRENLLLAIIITAFTLEICVIAQHIISRFIPWIIGQEKSRVSM